MNRISCRIGTSHCSFSLSFPSLVWLHFCCFSMCSTWRIFMTSHHRYVEIKIFLCALAVAHLLLLPYVRVSTVNPTYHNHHGCRYCHHSYQNHHNSYDHRPSPCHCQNYPPHLFHQGFLLLFHCRYHHLCHHCYLYFEL